MEAFNLLKQACWNKKFIKFSDLPIGEHVVSEFSLVQTRYGPTLRADLADKYVLLPKRFANEMTAERVAALNTVPHILIYKGVDASRNNL